MSQLNEKIEQLIVEQVNLPSPPAIAVQILNTVQQEESSIKDLARIISADPALTAKLLRVANSSIYSFLSKVTSVERALAVLGTNVIKSIALSFIIASDFKGEKSSSFDFDYFWRRSVTCGVAAELLTSALKERSEEIFVTALLVDIGVLIMHLSKGDDYDLVLREHKAGGGALAALERERYGFDHQQLGISLLKSWGLPEQIYQPIGFHHDALSAVEQDRRTVEILRIADLLSALYHGATSVEKVRLVQKELVETCNLEVQQARELINEVATKSIEVLAVFEIDAGDMKPYSQMLQEAKEEMGHLNLSYEQLVMELKETKKKDELLAIELRNANLQLKELVNRDGLTGLYNHRFFQEILSKEIARAIRYKSNVSLILFDVDSFKQVNDDYGHPAGDLVLKNIARVVERAVRPSDVVARYGGEEFGVILPETNEAGMKVFAERLLRSVEGGATMAEGQQIHVTISAGCVSFSPGHPEVSKERLIETADRGLYMSKKNGRNQFTALSPLDENG